VRAGGVVCSRSVALARHRRADRFGRMLLGRQVGNECDEELPPRSAEDHVAVEVRLHELEIFALRGARPETEESPDTDELSLTQNQEKGIRL